MTLDALEAAGPGARSVCRPLNTLLADMPAVTLTDGGSGGVATATRLSPAHRRRAAVRRRSALPMSGCWTMRRACWRWRNARPTGFCIPSSS